MYAPTGQIDLRKVLAATSALRQGKIASAPSSSGSGMSTMAKVAIGGGLVVAAILIVRRMRRSR